MKSSLLLAVLATALTVSAQSSEPLITFVDEFVTPDGHLGLVSVVRFSAGSSLLYDFCLNDENFVPGCRFGFGGGPDFATGLTGIVTTNYHRADKLTLNFEATTNIFNFVCNAFNEDNGCTDSTPIPGDVGHIDLAITKNTIFDNVGILSGQVIDNGQVTDRVVSYNDTFSANVTGSVFGEPVANTGDLGLFTNCIAERVSTCAVSQIMKAQKLSADALWQIQLLSHAVDQLQGK